MIFRKIKRDIKTLEVNIEMMNIRFSALEESMTRREMNLFHSFDRCLKDALKRIEKLENSTDD